MRTWGFLLGGLLVWAVHFFLLYGIASLWPGTKLAHWLTLAATIPAVAADAGLLWLAAALRLRTSSDELRGWVIDVGAVSAALSLVAVLWQALPAIVLQP